MKRIVLVGLLLAASLAQAMEKAAPLRGEWSPDEVAPGVFVIHTAADPLFSAGMAERSEGLEDLAEDGNATMLAEALAADAELTAEHEPDLLILCHGGNDMLRRQNRQQTIANLKAMIEEARSRDIPVVMLAVPQLGLLIDPAPFYGEIAREYNVPIDYDINRDILSYRKLKSDAIHPNAAGYTRLAKSVAELLKESGAL